MSYSNHRASHRPRPVPHRAMHQKPAQAVMTVAASAPAPHRPRTISSNFAMATSAPAPAKPSEEAVYASEMEAAYAVPPEHKTVSSNPYMTAYLPAPVSAPTVEATSDEEWLSGLGDLPAGAAAIDTLDPYYRASYPTLPSVSTLRSKGATHYLVQSADGHQNFTFFDDAGTVIFGPMTIAPGGAESVTPEEAEASKVPVPAHSKGDGLLPSQGSSGTSWVPWALVGGSVVIAAGVVFVATRGPKAKPVSANRRRRRKRRTSR